LATAGVTTGAARVTRAFATTGFARTLDLTAFFFALALEAVLFALAIMILLNKEHIRYNRLKIAHKINYAQESALFCKDLATIFLKLRRFICTTTEVFLFSKKHMCAFLKSLAGA